MTKGELKEAILVRKPEWRGRLRFNHTGSLTVRGLGTYYWVDLDEIESIDNEADWIIKNLTDIETA